MSEARAALIRMLQSAYSGELAASLAYEGHALSVSDPAERAEIERIRAQELDHRARVGALLAKLGAAPSPKKERLFFCIGSTISFLCRLGAFFPGGWFASMYGAGRLEAGNIVEYEDAAAFAMAEGLPERDVDDLLDMAEIEWDHELYFRLKAETSPLCRALPVWPAPPSRESIRAKAARHSRS